MSRLRVAWTITKLKVVRALLRPLMKLHVWYISRDKSMDRLTSTGKLPAKYVRNESPSGPDARMEYLIAKAKKGRRS
jgi:hypothetical protein